jgi:NAD(P)-dependent dehydrogenase (short-subunit alcohol dehydrogenase family)
VYVSSLSGRVAVITGAGRGIGREHALLFAAEGAKVVVNDAGASPAGQGSDGAPAEDVAALIRANGGVAVSDSHDVSDSKGAQQLIDRAITEFGRLDVLVNNAGILRDRMLVNMSDDEWDDIVRVHMRGHFLTTRAAARHWRDRHKAGEQVAAALINTSSTSGLFGNVGQANYGAAKTAIATFTIIAQMELERYGVRCNAIAPAAFTRLTEAVPGSAERREERRRATSGFDVEDPANIAPFVAYLATEDCPIAGRVFYVHGASVHLFQPWAIVSKIESDHPWTVAELKTAAAAFADVTFDLGKPY